jgi:hypothetical protein
MVAFNQIGSSPLYVADSNRSTGGWWGFVITRDLNEGEKLPAGPISLQEALTNVVWRGSFVYAATGPYPDVAGDPGAFVGMIKTFLANVSGAGPMIAGLIFLENGAVQTLEPAKFPTYILFNRSSGGVTISSGRGLGVNLTGVDGFRLDLNNNTMMTVPAAGDRIELNNSSQIATLSGQSAPSVRLPPSTGQLQFAGAASGAFTFALMIVQPTLYVKADWGFQLMIPNTEHRTSPNGILPYLAAWYPFAERGDADELLNFQAQVNVVNPRNGIANAAATVFYFADATGVALRSYYRTNYGKPVILRPVTEETGGQRRAGLMINAGDKLTPLQKGFRLAPVGDFIVSIDGAKPGVPEKLLCGLSGTESIAVLPDIPGSQHGARLRFVANQPANIPVFPLQAASPVGPPIDPKALPLGGRFQTSWVAVVAPPAAPGRPAHYAAAPKGAELFGEGSAGVDGLLGPKDPGTSLPGDAGVYFPMLPYAAVGEGDGDQDMTRDQLELVERQVVSPVRKRRIDGSAATNAAPAPENPLSPAIPAVGGDGLINTTTPAGFITRYASDGTWKQVLLAQVQPNSGPATRQMGFTALAPELQAAFQTSDQFLVIANNKTLGRAESGTFMPPSSQDIFDGSARFFNTVNIGAWDFACHTGTENKYGDYRSVIIVKGMKGKIFDFEIDPVTKKPIPVGLVFSPDKWTMKETFAAPNPPDLSELSQLSNWLVDFCKDAYGKRDNAYFASFVKIIRDETWTGILILKAAIAGIPDDIKGILAGIDDMNDFNAHHIGIQIGQIDKKTIQQTGTSSMFGLIYYVNPRYDDTQGPHAIPANDPIASYEFSVLTLKVLFENSTIKKFESLAQTVLNRIFGAAVTKMVDLKSDNVVTEVVNQFNAVLLEGSVQKNAGTVVYNLASRWPNRFSLANNILTEVEILTAQMSTRDDGSKSGEIVSWLAMSGYMNFAVIQPPESDPPLSPFDIFSFGPDTDQKGSRQGLSFSNLGLRISAPADPANTDAASRQTNMIETGITFNAQDSRYRQAGLYKSFQLEVLGLLSGNANPKDETEKSDPESLGYLSAITQYKLRGVTSGSIGWHGLNFRLNLGTPGALAGKVNLDSSLLLAWADDSGADGATTDYQAMVGVHLPGAGAGGELFSIQTVIKLSIGLIQLLYVPPVEGDAKKKGGFLLVLNEIALKLLGLLKIPPNGNTAFLLFGDPDAANSTGLGWFAVYKQDQKKKQTA